MKNKIFIILMSLTVAANVRANDGVYYVSGNQLVPIEETDISVKKEVLTIKLRDNNMADVIVDYEFYNGGKDKDVLMGFEADPPYNAFDTLTSSTGHPFIYNFTVELNGEKTAWQHMKCLMPDDSELDSHTFRPIDEREWKQSDNDVGAETFYNSKLDSTCAFAYVYSFKAHFRQGVNKLRHTYQYLTSTSVGCIFILPYKLTPATRWANHGIDDFTLRVEAENTAKNFIINNSSFPNHDFYITKGSGKVRQREMFDTASTEVTLRNGTVEWHGTNFKPKEELDIESADLLLWEDKKHSFASFYDRSDRYTPRRFLMFTKYADKCFDDDFKPDKVLLRLIRNLPYAHRGYVFKDTTLRKIFESQWWYMPDPDWKMSTDDFTPQELRYIQGKMD